jgi:hypothetical protein
MLRAMATDLLRALHAPLADEVAGLALAEDGLRGELDLRYGVVALQLDHDPEAEALRVSVRLPPPPAAGADFLVWCLALNAQYWDAKLALDEGGYLLVHADLDATPHTDVAVLQVLLIDRIDTIAELIDDDLCDYLLEHRLGTPEQLARWRTELSA